MNRRPITRWFTGRNQPGNPVGERHVLDRVLSELSAPRLVSVSAIGLFSGSGERFESSDGPAGGWESDRRCDSR